MRVVPASAGTDVRIDEGCRILRPDLLSVGSNVRIDVGVVISGDHPVTLGDFVHLAAGAKIFASGGPVTLGHFSALSSDVKVYTVTDDYGASRLTNPTVPDDLRALVLGGVHVAEHAVIGAGSVVLPGSTLGAGVAVGALSLIGGDIEPGLVMAGWPARPIGRRDVAVLDRLGMECRTRSAVVRGEG